MSETIQLKDLLSEIVSFSPKIEGPITIPVTGIAWDYQKILPGYIYTCLEDEEFGEPHISGNALQHYRDALKHGADVFLVSENADIKTPSGKTLIRISGDLNACMAKLAKAIHSDPFKNIKVIAVTGTKGKTTTCQILEDAYSALGYKTGYIGTIGVFMPSKTLSPGMLSNPTATDLFEYGAMMRDAGVEIVFMEVTSHGMYYRRNCAMNFDVAVFTNLGVDHLDFHTTKDQYKTEKLKLFSSLGSEGKFSTAVLNADESHWTDFYAAIPNDHIQSGLVKVITYGIKNKEADITAYPEEMTSSGSVFRIYRHNACIDHLQVALPGLFNIYNALGAISVMLTEDLSHQQVKEGISKAGSVKGRFEKVENSGGLHIFIDYAHTADSLKNILSSLREISSERLLCVFGCGGDRDKTKRPQMGEVAVTLADEVWITSDNPRSENPEAIIDDILAGMPHNSNKRVHRISDRSVAIAECLSAAKPGDTVLIAGKGHEQYQIIKRRKIYFSDREEVNRYFGTRSNHSVSVDRCALVISQQALRNNFHLIIEDMPDGLDYMTVVKDNAAGIGMLETAKMALEFGTVGLICSNLHEAAELRKHFIEIPILVLGERSVTELAECIRLNLTLQMQTEPILLALNQAAAELNSKSRIHIKVDTGMSRYGVKPDLTPDYYRLATEQPFLEIEGIMTHFAMSDELDKTFANVQLSRFEQVLQRIKQNHPAPKYIHCCNSGGYLDLPQAHFNLVRIGILPTGVYPSKVCRRIDLDGRKLEPVISLYSRISLIKQIECGDKIGYGMRFTAEKPMRIAVIPMGYGDGYPRLRNCGRVLINGYSAPVLGGVSLDALTADITEIPNTTVGDKVTLIGKDNGEEITVTELADYAGTVTYHVLTALNTRIGRAYM